MVVGPAGGVEADDCDGGESFSIVPYGAWNRDQRNAF